MCKKVKKIKSFWGNLNSTLIGLFTPQEYQINSEPDCTAIMVRDVICHSEIMSPFWPSTLHTISDRLRKNKEWYVSSHMASSINLFICCFYRSVSNSETLELIYQPRFKDKYLHIWSRHALIWISLIKGASYVIFKCSFGCLQLEHEVDWRLNCSDQKPVAVT